MLLGVIASIPSSRAENINLIQNGSFEQPQINQAWGLYTGVPSWRDGTFGGMLEIWNAPAMGLQAPDGNQILELNSTGQHEIKQDVIVTPNTNYLLSYWHKKRNSIEESSTFGVDGTDYEIAYSQCITDNFDWNLCQLEFNSEDNYMITVIISPDTAGSMGNLIDNVSLIELPGPTPTETLEPTPTITEPTIEPTSSGSPTQTPEPTILPSETVVSPSGDPSPTQSTLVPEPSFSDSPTMQPTLIVPSDSPPTVIEEPTEAPVEQQTINIIPEGYLMLENGVVLEKDVVESLQIFESPKELLVTIFVNPAKAFKALQNIGADLPPKKRKKAQQAVFPVIIVGQIVASTTSFLVQRRVGK